MIKKNSVLIGFIIFLLISLLAGCSDGFNNSEENDEPENPLQSQIREVVSEYSNDKVESISVYFSDIYYADYDDYGGFRLDVCVKDGYSECATAYEVLNDVCKILMEDSEEVVKKFVKITVKAEPETVNYAGVTWSKSRIEFLVYTIDLINDSEDYPIYADLAGDIPDGLDHIVYHGVVSLRTGASAYPDYKLYFPTVEELYQFPDLKVCYLKVPYTGYNGKSKDEIIEEYQKIFGSRVELKFFD